MANAPPRPIRPPVEIAWLVDAVGEDAALHAIEQAGGTAVYCARTPNQGSELARLVGLPGARALAEIRGGEEIRIPLARDWRMRLYRARGLSYREIARRLGCWESTVHRHLQAALMTEAQGSLFPADPAAAGVPAPARAREDAREPARRRRG
jgi:Sigma-70, region 4